MKKIPDRAIVYFINTQKPSTLTKLKECIMGMGIDAGDAELIMWSAMDKGILDFDRNFHAIVGKGWKL